MIANLAGFADRYKAADLRIYPLSVGPAGDRGKESNLWMQDLVSDVSEIDYVISHIEIPRLPQDNRHRGQLHGPI